MSLPDFFHLACLSFVHVVARINHLLFFIPKLNSIVETHHILFSHSPVNAYLGYFQLFALISLGYIPKSGTVGVQGRLIFSFKKYCRTSFQGDCPNLPQELVGMCVCFQIGHMYVVHHQNDVKKIKVKGVVTRPTCPVL